MAPPTASPPARARTHIDTVTRSPAEKATYLLDTVGARIATVGLGLDDAGPLKSWARGDTAPRAEDVTERLDTLYHALRAVSEAYSPSVAARMVRSANPDLDDRAPVTVLGGTDPDRCRLVRAAVHAFCEH